MAREGYIQVAGVLLVDLTPRIAESVEIGSVQTCPCYPTGGWSPNGAILQIEFHEYVSERLLGNRWVDGLRSWAKNRTSVCS